MPMATTPPVAMPDANKLPTIPGRLANASGTNVTPTPIPSDTTRISIGRRSSSSAVLAPPLPQPGVAGVMDDA